MLLFDRLNFLLIVFIFMFSFSIQTSKTEKYKVDMICS